MLLEMQKEGQDVPALNSRPSLDVGLSLHYSDYKEVKCSRVPTFNGLGRIPYSELAIYCAANGYRGEELVGQIKLLQCIDVIYGNVESKHISSKTPKENTTPVAPPKAKDVAAAAAAKKARLRPPQSNLKK